MLTYSFNSQHLTVKNLPKGLPTGCIGQRTKTKQQLKSNNNNIDKRIKKVIMIIMYNDDDDDNNNNNNNNNIKIS